MNNFLAEFLAEYSMSTIIIAIVSAIISCILKSVFKNKFSRFINNCLPFITSIALAFLYDLIFVSRYFRIEHSIIYSGIVSGTVAIAISVIVKKISKGEIFIKNTLFLALEGLLEGYVKSDCIFEVVSAIIDLLESEQKEDSQIEKEQEIIKLLKDNSNYDIPEIELTSIAEIIITTIKVNNLNSKT